MKNSDMDEKEIKALIKAVERLLGNPLEADAEEVQALFAELPAGMDPANRVFELATKVAQRYRLRGDALPAHVEEALRFTKRIILGEDLETADSHSVIDAVLNPIRGPVREVSYAFRNRREQTERDRELLERLSSEVKKDWSKDSQR